jgi:hypothetical protein
VHDPLRVEVVVGQVHGQLRPATADRDQVHACPAVEGRAADAFLELIQVALVQLGPTLRVFHARECTA